MSEESDRLRLVAGTLGIGRARRHVLLCAEPTKPKCAAKEVGAGSGRTSSGDSSNWASTGRPRRTATPRARGRGALALRPPEQGGLPEDLRLRADRGRLPGRGLVPLGHRPGDGADPPRARPRRPAGRGVRLRPRPARPLTGPPSRFRPPRDAPSRGESPPGATNLDPAAPDDLRGPLRPLRPGCARPLRAEPRLAPPPRRGRGRRRGPGDAPRRRPGPARHGPLAPPLARDRGPERDPTPLPRGEPPPPARRGRRPARGAPVDRRPRRPRRDAEGGRRGGPRPRRSRTGARSCCASTRTSRLGRSLSAWAWTWRPSAGG